MFVNVAESNRDRLGFKEAVLSSFSFLEQDHNFRVVKTAPTFVRYESTTVFANLYHGRASYELGFEIGRLNDGTGQEEHPYSLDILIELMGAQEETGYSFLQASTQARVKELVPKLANLVRCYAAPALTGDPHTFEQLMNTRSRISNRIHKEMRLRDVRQSADTAWRTRDYAALADLYKSISDDLTPTEIKKLEYVKKQL